MQRQSDVTDYLSSKQLPWLQLFVFARHDYLLPSSTGILNAVQRQTAVTAYLKSKQLLLFVSTRLISQSLPVVLNIGVDYRIENTHKAGGEARLDNIGLTFHAFHTCFHPAH